MDELLWDPWNEPHLTRERPGRTRITRAEVDALYAGRWEWAAHLEPLPNGELEYQQRIIGRTPAGRWLTVACQVVELDGVERRRPVTAWEAAPAEIALYLETYPNEER